MVTKDGNGVQQEEHPQAEHQHKQWDSGLPGGGPQEEGEHTPCREEDTNGVTQTAVGVGRGNVEEWSQDRTQGHEEGTVTQQEDGTKQVVVDNGPDTGDDLDQTTGEEQGTDQGCRGWGVSGTRDDQTQRK